MITSNIIDGLVKLILSFGHETIMTPTIILGFIWLNRDIFYHATCILLLSMLFSFALKVTFKKISTYGFAFPSGHMQASVAIYGWLAYKYNKQFGYIFATIILSGIGISLVYAGYHDYPDALGGLFFALILISLYNFSLSKMKKNIDIISFIFATCLMLYIFWRQQQILPHLWLAYYALIGFMLSARLFGSEIELTSKSQRILASMIFFLLMLTIHKIFSWIIINDLPVYFSQIKWLLIGAVIPCSSLFTKKIFICSRSSNKNYIDKSNSKKEQIHH